MNEEIKTEPRIYLAMAAINRDIREIEKSRKNEQQGFRFRGIDDLYNHLHDIFAAHGVVCIPCVQSLERSDFNNAKGNRTNCSVVKVAYKFYATDGSSVEAVTVGEAFDMADKATNKAMSAAQKYLLVQTFLIPTQDIDDSDRDSTIDPAEELRGMDDLRRRERALEEQREELRREIEKNPSVDYIPGHSPEEIAAKAKSAPKTDESTETQEKPDGKPSGSEPEAKKARKTPEKPAEAPAPKPEAPAEPVGWQGYAIKEIAMSKFNGRKLGDLSKREIEGLKTGWVDKYSSKFAGNPGKEMEAKMITEAFEELSGR